MFFKTVRFLILGVILSGFATGSPAAQPKATQKGKSSSLIVRLDARLALALWHSITKTEVAESELLRYFCTRDFSDEFDKRRQIKAAKFLYANCLTDVTGPKTFTVDVRETLEKYDFGAHSYKMPLYQGDKTYILAGNEYERISGTEVIYREGNRKENGRFDVNGAGVRIWYNILEEMRNLEANEVTAERIQPRLNEVRNSVMMTLFLKPVSASEQAGPDGYGNYNTGFRLQTISFEVTKFIVRIPAEAPILQNGTVVRPGKKEIIIKSWVPRNGKAKWGGPNIAGIWEAAYKTKAATLTMQSMGQPVNYISSHKEALNIKQDRELLSGTFNEEYSYMGPLGDMREEKRNGETEGTIDRNGNFNIGGLTGYAGIDVLDVKKRDDPASQFHTDDVNFKMTRKEENSQAQTRNSDDPSDSSTNESQTSEILETATSNKYQSSRTFENGPSLEEVIEALHSYEQSEEKKGTVQLLDMNGEQGSISWIQSIGATGKTVTTKVSVESLDSGAKVTVTLLSSQGLKIKKTSATREMGLVFAEIDKITQ